MVPPEVKMGMKKAISNLDPLICYHLLKHRFDNSGHKVNFPGWQSNQTNIDRTNAIIKRIASEFSNNPNVVPMISPLNESVLSDVFSVTSR
jgi:hypothetical protein